MKTAKFIISKDAFFNAIGLSNFDITIVSGCAYKNKIILYVKGDDIRIPEETALSFPHCDIVVQNTHIEKLEQK